MKLPHILAALFLIPLFIRGQSIEGISIITPLQQGYFSVLKDNKWGILDSTGVLVVGFRNDLIYNLNPTVKDDLGVASQQFPTISEERSIIRKRINGIDYYGFIDSKGTTVIPSQFLNVTNFHNGFAFALKVEEKFLGRNDLLDKKLKSYRYDIALIDRAGKVKLYLTGPFPVALSKEKLRNPPPIEARWLGKNLVGVKNPDKTWSLLNLTNSNENLD